MSETTAIYPGSFDPLTNGHLDLIGRSSRIFEHLVVALLINVEKQPLFTLDERLEMLQLATEGMAKVSVETFSGLLVDYAMRRNAQVIVRGVRAFSDYEYELQMALMNRKLEARVETVFLMPAEPYTYVSSRLVKQVFQLGGPVGDLVPPLVEERLRKKLAGQQARVAPA